MTNILDEDEHKKRCTNSYCDDSDCEDSDCDAHEKICTNSDCEDSDCEDSDCEAGWNVDDFRQKYDKRRVFVNNRNGTRSFYDVEFASGEACLCELKTCQQITKIDDSKWEIKYVNISDQQTGVQEYIRPRNIKVHTHPYSSAERSVIVDFDPIRNPPKPNEFSIFGGPGGLGFGWSVLTGMKKI